MLLISGLIMSPFRDGLQRLITLSQNFLGVFSLIGALAAAAWEISLYSMLSFYGKYGFWSWTDTWLGTCLDMTSKPDFQNIVATLRSNAKSKVASPDKPFSLLFRTTIQTHQETPSNFHPQPSCSNLFKEFFFIMDIISNLLIWRFNYYFLLEDQLQMKPVLRV